MRFGEYLVKEGLITKDQIDDIIAHQLAGNNSKKFGEIAVELGMIGNAELEKAFKAFSELEG